jgi:hypothetical protein
MATSGPFKAEDHTNNGGAGQNEAGLFRARYGRQAHPASSRCSTVRDDGGMLLTHGTVLRLTIQCVAQCLSS